MKSVAQAVVVLPDIRSAHNVGSIFRTCDAAGIDRVYLAGYTPDPLDRFGRPVKEIAKTALGAEKAIPWEHVGETLKLLAKLKKEGFTVVAIELSEKSMDYKTVAVAPDAKVAFVFGNEVDGVSTEILERCDIVAHIPMGGEKESLNVSVAAGIALFRILGI